MIAALERRILGEWPALRLPGERPSKLECFVTSGAPGKHGKVMAVVFRSDDSKPLLVIKIPRDLAARPWAEREWHTLRELEDAARDLAGVSFPRAIILESEGARFAAGQTLLPGVTGDRLFTTLGRDESAYAAICKLAVDWLRVFWSRTGFLEGIEGALWETIREGTVEFLSRFAKTAQAQSGIESLVAEIESRREESALYVWGHGDLVPSNLIVHEGKAAAVDWEFAQRRQLPWVDPLHFAVSFTLLRGVLARRPRVEAFASGFLESGSFRDSNFAFLSAAFEEGGVPTSILGLALPAYCAYFTIQMTRFFGADYPATRDWAEITLRCADSEARQNVQTSFASFHPPRP